MEKKVSTESFPQDFSSNFPFGTLLESSFFVQKFNFDFPRKLSIFFWVKNSRKCCGSGLFSCWQLWFHAKNCQKNLGEKLVKMLWFWYFLAVDNFDFTRKIVKKNLVKKSWKCCGFGHFSYWQLWFHEKNCQKKFGWKTCENVVVLGFLALDNFDFTRKSVKTIWGEISWKCCGFVKIEFLDKNLTFRIVCAAKKI